MNRKIEDYDQWWYNIGSGIEKDLHEDWEEYVNKVSHSAWEKAEELAKNKEEGANDEKTR